MGCKGWQTFLASLLSGRRHLPNGRIWTVYLASFSVLASCGGTPATAVPSPSPPTYNFAGISTHLHADVAQGIRATISWSTSPRTGAQSAQSTWIGIFGAADPTTHLSLQIAQIGWKELPPKPPRVFWEWGTDRDHVSILYGQTVLPNDHLDVELDRAADGTFTFFVNGDLVRTELLSWRPSFIAAAAETHDPTDVLAGSELAPELISPLDWKLDGKWQAIGVPTFSTYSQYHATGDSSGNLHVWDARQGNP